MTKFFRHYNDRYYACSNHYYSDTLDLILKRYVLRKLIDNINVIDGNPVIQQAVGIALGTNCAPQIADKAPRP
jgi:hypothetical protein